MRRYVSNQTPDNVLVRRLSPKGGGHEAVCQQGRWATKGVDMRQCVNKDAGHRRGWT